MSRRSTGPSLDDGIMRLEQIQDGIAVPSFEALDLEPGGLHVMCADVAAPFQEGDSWELTLEFVNGNGNSARRTVAAAVEDR